MSGEDEYESLSDGASLGVVLCAGAMAGMMEHCVMFPVDCVKTRMQARAATKFPRGFWEGSVIYIYTYIMDSLQQTSKSSKNLRCNSDAGLGM